MGIGALLGRRAVLEAMPPWQFGGDMISRVGDHETTWNALPHKFEAGTPNVGDAVGLAAAVEWLDALGAERVIAHERALVARALAQLGMLPGLTLYGPPAAERSGVVSFSVERAQGRLTRPGRRRAGAERPGRAAGRIRSDEARRGAATVWGRWGGGVRRVGGGGALCSAAMYAIAIIRYRRPIEEVVAVQDAHRSYMGELKAAGTLVASGPLVPRYGGALLLRVTTPTPTRRSSACATATRTCARAWRSTSCCRGTRRPAARTSTAPRAPGRRTRRRSDRRAAPGAPPAPRGA
jgi:uncharacterized protein YciI